MEIYKIVTGILEENCYLLVKGNECLLVDPGSDAQSIIEKISGLFLKGILVTHHHFDHIGALDDLISLYKVEVYDSNTCSNGKYRVGEFNFDVILTPGHTNDSITFYFEDDNVMFTGDFLFKGTIGRTDLATGNESSMKESLVAIKQYDDNIVIYPGHGEITTLKEEKNNNQYLFTNW